jgi:hypothetical protein
MISFIDEHRGVFGVEPICRLLPIAPSTYYENVRNGLRQTRCGSNWFASAEYCQPVPFIYGSVTRSILKCLWEQFLFCSLNGRQTVASVVCDPDSFFLVIEVDDGEHPTKDLLAGVAEYRLRASSGYPIGNTLEALTTKLRISRRRCSK